MAMNVSGTPTSAFPRKLFVAIILLYGVFLLIDFSGSRRSMVSYQELEEEAKNRLFNVKDRLRSSYPDESTLSLGTSSQFEGPQVSIHAIEWGGRSFMESDQDSVNRSGAMLFLKGTNASFDPDHPNWGLPNLHAGSSAVTLYEPEGTIGRILKGIIGLKANNEGPYRIYRKKLLSDNPEFNDRFIEMQLWLTSFKLRIEARPDIVTSEKPKDAKRITYPSWYYGLGSGRTTLDELREEWDNLRYGNLNIVLRVSPNNAPWYVKTKNQDSGYVVINDKPDMAVAALLCSELVVGNEEGERRIGVAMQTGSALTFYPQYRREERTYFETIDVSQKISAEAEELIRTKEPPPTNRTNTGIWNQAQYAWIHFDNIGSWKTGKFLGAKRKFADYMDATFILPIFVIGEWEVRMPSDLVKWKPLPSPVIEQPGLLDRLIPDLHLGIFGRLLSGGMGAFLILLVLSMFFPPVLQIVNVIWGVFARMLQIIAGKK